MDKIVLLKIGLLFICLSICGAQKNYYTIVFPETFRPNSDLDIAITFFSGGDESRNLSVTISVSREVSGLQPLIPGKGNSAEITFPVAPETTGLLSLKIGSWVPGIYKIKATGKGPINFEKNDYATLKSKTNSIIIHTDKAMYKPSQLVLFRVIVVDSELLPYKKNDLTVRITDQEENRIKEWNNVTLDHGIFQEKLQLSDQPIIGDWAISARLGFDESDMDKNETVIFTVQEYVLPKFEVIIGTPYVSFKSNPDPEFVITTDAKYTFGEEVNGDLELSLDMLHCPFKPSKDPKKQTDCALKPIKVKVGINGSSPVTLKASDLYERIPLLPLPRSRVSYRNTIIKIVAVVTERSTGIQRNHTATMIIYAEDRKLTITQPSYFKPGIPYQVAVHLLKQNDKPVINSKGEVAMVQEIVDSEQKENFVQRRALSKDGVAVFTVNPPLDGTSIIITTHYEDISASETTYTVKSKSYRFLTINVATKNPKVGEEIELEVKTTFSMSNPLFYVVVGRGHICRTGMEVVGDGESEATISFMVTNLMAPHMRIVIYYFDSGSGLITADSLNVNIGGTIRTPVSVKTSDASLEPGNEITLTIDTLPNSLVGLQSVDKSVLLLKSGNDVTQQKIFNELKMYDIGREVSDDDELFGGFWRRPDYGGTFQEIFQYCGLSLITNGEPDIIPPDQKIGHDQGESEDDDFDGNQPEIPNDSDDDEPIRVRKVFPETFIWSTIKTTNSTTQLTYTVPDTITTWVINAYAINDEHGLGIMDQSTNFTVFREFFISLNLPYSVIRNEIIDLQVLVFNYQQNDSQVRVELTNDADEFNFMDEQENSVTISIDGQIMTNTKLAKSNEATEFRFRIQPTTVGHIKLKVKATSLTAGDALVQQLLVKAEGITEYFNRAILIDLRNKKQLSIEVDIPLPTNMIKGSEFIEFSVTGDFVAPVLNNLDNLIRMPAGCGEQNLLYFVPDVVVLKYLKSTNTLTPATKKTLETHLTTGYQRQLTYKRKDGSYSAWGNKDKIGSTWLTAYVLKSFNLAKPYITIDAKATYDAQKFLVGVQQPNGEFKEMGNIIYHKAMKGGSDGSSVTLTAFCLIAFLEEKRQVDRKFQPAVDKALSFIESRLDTIENVYDLTIVNYALHLSQKSDKIKNKAFDRLQKKRTQQGQMAYWPASKMEGKAPIDVEATSYALLTYGTRNLTEDCLPVLRWLISRRSSLGGYESSQETVLAIQSMATVSRTFQNSQDSKIDLKIEYLGQSQKYTIDRNNALIKQKTPLPKAVRSIKLKATGNGVAVGQLSWNYNVPIRNTLPFFNITALAKLIKNGSHKIKACTSYLGDGTTNMVLLEMNTHSGHKWDKNSLPAIHERLKRRDLTNGDTLATFYYESIPKDSDICVEINEISASAVKNLKEAPVSVYDYYENYKRAEAFYDIPK